MPSMKCCVVGCFDNTSKRHTFPRPDKQGKLFDLWLLQIKNPKFENKELKQILNYTVCDRHFEDRFKVAGTRRGLVYDAYPTLYLTDSADDESVPMKKAKMDEGAELRPWFVDHTYSMHDDDLATTAPSASAQLSAPSTSAQQSVPSTSAHHSAPSTSAHHSANSTSAHHSAPSTSAQLPSISSAQTIEEQLSASLPEESSTSAQQPSIFSAGNIEGQLPASLPDESFTSKKLQGSKTRVVGRRQVSVLQTIKINKRSQLSQKERIIHDRMVFWSRRAARLQHSMNLEKRAKKAKDLLKEPSFSNLLKFVSEPTYNFILGQIRNQHVKPRGRRYTEDELVLCLSICKASGRGYNFLSKIFALPSKRTLTNLMNKIPLRPGINQNLFDNLKQKVSKLSLKERTCIIMWDEMYLVLDLQYDRRFDLIEGVPDTGYSRSAGLANYALVFMVKGVFKQWKQPISYYFSSNSVSTVTLKKLIKDNITACQKSGLNVVASVSDQMGSNCAAINGLLRDSKQEYLREGNAEYTYRGFLVNGKEIVPLFDVPHLFKGLRNNLLTKFLHFFYMSKNRVAKWDHVEKFYYLDSEEEDRICIKLTDQHVLKDKIKKMKVSYCTQVFSHSVGSVMKNFSRCTDPGSPNLPREAEDTAELILFLDKLFDSLNTSSMLTPVKHKPLKGGVTASSDHEKYWRSAIQIIESMGYYSEKKKRLVTVPSLTNLLSTLRGFIRLKDILLNKLKFKYFLTRAFNQDPLENFFGAIRSHGVRHVSPGVVGFKNSFKALLINNLMSRHSAQANCEEDFSTGSLHNLKHFLKSLNPEPDSETVEPQLDMPTINIKKSRISENITSYLSGYFVHKLFKIIKCKECQNLLLAHNTNVPSEFIEARRYTKDSRLVKPGGFFNFVVSQSLSYLYYLIPRMCHVKNIGLKLTNILEQQLQQQFRPLNCPLHPNESTKQILKLIIRCSIYFWCKKVNKIGRGIESKFHINLNKQPNNLTLVDPIKRIAYQRHINHVKRFKKNN